MAVRRIAAFRERELMADQPEYCSIIAHGLPQERYAAQNSPDEWVILYTVENNGENVLTTLEGLSRNIRFPHS
jgi:hypothetical protein